MAYEGLGWMVATSVMLGSLKEFDVFFMNQFSQAPENDIMVISNFFENSRRYSQVKVHHRYQRHLR
jgi:hypothetical protein